MHYANKNSHTGVNTNLPNVLLCMRNIKATVKWAFLKGSVTCLVSFCYDKEYCNDDKNPQLTLVSTPFT